MSAPTPTTTGKKKTSKLRASARKFTPRARPAPASTAPVSSTKKMRPAARSFTPSRSPPQMSPMTPLQGSPMLMPGSPYHAPGQGMPIPHMGHSPHHSPHMQPMVNMGMNMPHYSMGPGRHNAAMAQPHPNYRYNAVNGGGRVIPPNGRSHSPAPSTSPAPSDVPSGPSEAELTKQKQTGEAKAEAEAQVKAAEVEERKIKEAEAKAKADAAKAKADAAKAKAEAEAKAAAAKAEADANAAKAEVEQSRVEEEKRKAQQAAAQQAEASAAESKKLKYSRGELISMRAAVNSHGYGSHLKAPIAAVGIKLGGGRGRGGNKGNYEQGKSRRDRGRRKGKGRADWGKSPKANNHRDNTPVKPIEVTDAGWKPKKDVPPDQKYIMRVVGILNKVTEAKLDYFVQKTLDISEIKDVNMLRDVTHAVFDQALIHPQGSAIYAAFASKLKPELPTFPEEKADFTRILIGLVQAEFEKGQEELDEEKKAEMQPDDIKEWEIKQKLRMLATMQLIGELFVLDILKRRVVEVNCILHLLREDPPQPEDIQAFCKLVETTGAKLDAINAPREVRASKRQFLDGVMNRIARLAEDDRLGSKEQFSLIDLMALRKNGWVKVERGKKGASKPAPAKKISNREREREREHHRRFAEKERQRQERSYRGNSGRGGHKYRRSNKPNTEFQSIRARGKRRRDRGDRAERVDSTRDIARAPVTPRNAAPEAVTHTNNAFDCLDASASEEDNSHDETSHAEESGNEASQIENGEQASKKKMDRESIVLEYANTVKEYCTSGDLDAALQRLDDSVGTKEFGWEFFPRGLRAVDELKDRDRERFNKLLLALIDSKFITAENVKDGVADYIAFIPGIMSDVPYVFKFVSDSLALLQTVDVLDPLSYMFSLEETEDTEDTEDTEEDLPTPLNGMDKFLWACSIPSAVISLANETKAKAVASEKKGEEDEESLSEEAVATTIAAADARIEAALARLSEEKAKLVELLASVKPGRNGPLTMKDVGRKMKMKKLEPAVIEIVTS